MQKYILKISLICLFLFSMNSCRTNMLEGNEKLLVKNKFKYEDKRIYGAITLNRYVKQKPNSKFIIVPFSLWLYDGTKKDLIDVFEAYDELPRSERNQHNLDSLYKAYGKPQYVGKKEWWPRTLYKLGQPPVIVNEKYTQQTTTTLQNYFIKKGYRHANVHYEIKDSKDLIDPDKKQIITYKIDAGAPTKIENYVKDIEDPEIRGIILDYDKKARIEAGQILDEYALKNELDYYTGAIRDNGYYKFNADKQNMFYESDSTIDPYHYPLTLKVTTGDSVNRSFRKNYIGRIVTSLTLPDMIDDKNKKLNCGQLDSLNREPLCNRFYNKKGLQFIKDTLTQLRTAMGETNFNADKTNIMNNLYRYLDQHADQRKFTYFKNKVITYPLIISSGDLYRENEVTKSKQNYFLLDNFNLIKGIDDIDSTTYNINYEFQLTPKKRQRLQVLAELNYSEFLRVGTTLGAEYFRRNLLRGGENLTTSMSVTLGTVSNPDQNKKNSVFNAYDFSLQSSLKFPRWILLGNLGIQKLKQAAPTSSILAGISWQNNIGLGRINYNTQLNYFLQPNDLTTHSFSLVNIQYTNHQNPDRYYDVRTRDFETVSTVLDYYQVYNPEAQVWLDTGVYTPYSMVDYIFDQDTQFVDYLQTIDPSLRTKFRYVYRNKEINTQNILITSMIYNLAYNENRDALNLNPWSMYFKFELAGTLLSLVDKAFSKSDSHEILGVNYSQFFKVETDIRKQKTIRGNSRVVGRFFFGIGIPFGVSQNLPYDRNYIAGGANDVRAWKPFDLGPGDSKDEFSLGGLDNLKLLTSVEWRYPLSESIEGALFTDIGNVWGTNKDYQYVFKLSDFYQQVGIGSGIGLRYNLGFFTVRLDWAFKIYDPKYDLGDRWNFKRLGFDKTGLSQSRLNFAIGYPF